MLKLHAKLLTLGLTMTLLASCNLMSILDPPKINDPVLVNRGANFCEIAKPISWSTKDTPETVREIKEHNAVWHKLCDKLTVPSPTAF